MRKKMISLLVLIALTAFSFQYCALAEDQGAAVPSEAVFVFPASLQMIDVEAFEGTAVQTIILPDGFVRIEDGAFADARRLTDVYISPTTRYISETAFSHVARFTVHGIEGSYAEEWAEKHKVPFVAEDIWRLVFDNSKAVNIHECETDCTYRTVNPDRDVKTVSWEEDLESKRPQDRPELNPIDYRFP